MQINVLRRSNRDPLRAPEALIRARRGFIGAISGLVAPALLAPLQLLAPQSRAVAQPIHLPRPRSLKSLVDDAASHGRPIVAMFSLEGCPYCEAMRRQQLLGLAREQAARGIQVVEFDMRDERAFDAHASGPSSRMAARAATPQASFVESGSPAALARALEIRMAPTVVFLGPSGEVAPRLVGYGSPDFFSAYLDERIDRAKAALDRGRRPGAG